MPGFLQDFHQMFSEQALPPQAVQDLLKSLFIFFVTPLLLLSLSWVIASRTGHSTALQFSSGEKLIVGSNMLPSDDNSLDQYVGEAGQKPSILCESIKPAQENTP